MNIQKMHIKFLVLYKIYELYKTCKKFELKMASNLKCRFFVYTNNVHYTNSIELAN